MKGKSGVQGKKEEEKAVVGISPGGISTSGSTMLAMVGAYDAGVLIHSVNTPVGALHQHLGKDQLLNTLCAPPPITRGKVG